MTFVPHLACPTPEHTGEVAFDHWAAMATRTGSLHLVRSPLPVSARLIQDREDHLRARSLGNRLDRLGDPDREDPARMQRLTQHGILDAQVPRHRVDLEPRACWDPRDGAGDFVEQGEDVARITRIARGHQVGEDKARRRVGDQARLAAELRRAIPLAFDKRCDGAIIGIDNFTMAEFFPLGEPGGLRTDMRMRAQRGVQRLGQALTRGGAPRARVGQALLGLLPQRGDGLPQVEEHLFRLAYKLDTDLALPSALAAKAPHDLVQCLRQILRLTRERRGGTATVLGQVCDACERFFWAFYSVVASVTRWLPCSLGNVSMTRWAGLTSPASMAAAAWMAMRASMRASSIRRRNSARVVGSTKCACAGLT